MMAKWKDKLRAVKQAAQARAVLAKDNVSTAGKGYNASLRLKADKPLVRWYDANLKGRTVEDAEKILWNGVNVTKEITLDQANTIIAVIELTGGKGTG